MTRAALIAAAILLCGSAPAWVQEPPARFGTSVCTVRIAFRPPERVSQLCPKPSRPGHVVRGCWKPAQNAIYMPSPWDCGTDAQCAQLLRHEVAHACGGWSHEP